MLKASVGHGYILCTDMDRLTEGRLLASRSLAAAAGSLSLRQPVGNFAASAVGLSFEKQVNPFCCVPLAARYGLWKVKSPREAN